MQRLLLTGASGFLGWNICQLAAKEWQIAGTAHSKQIDLAGIQISNVDLCDFDELKDLFEKAKPDAVIHTAASSDPNYCELNTAATNNINFDVPIMLASLCKERNIPFVFTSTDLVFDGEQGNYTEADDTCPVNVYGEQKADAEIDIMSINPNAIICRMPLMFGDGGPVAKSFLQPFLQKMRASEPLSLFHDEYRSVVGGQSAAKGLLMALEKFEGGIYHLGGRERISRYDFGLMIKEAFDLPQAVITSCSQRDVKMAAPRPADVSMDSTKAYALGYEPMLVMEELRGLVGRI